MGIDRLCFNLVIFSIATAVVNNYEGYKLYKVIPRTVDEVENLLNIQRSGMTEFWDDRFDVNHNVKIMVSPNFEGELLEMLRKAKIEAKLVITDVQRAIDDQLLPTRRGTGRRGGGSGSAGNGGTGGGNGGSGSGGSESGGNGNSGSGNDATGNGKGDGDGASIRGDGSDSGYWVWTWTTGHGSGGRRQYARNSHTLFSLTWDRYYSLESIYTWLDELAEAFPDRAKTIVMGKSVEGRDIKGIVIDYHPERTDKKIGMFEGAVHAREWISPATITWIIKEFLTSVDPEVVALATNFEWHFFPVVNPDGYSYTFTNHRMWRKNRSTANFTSCASSGVDDDMSNGVDLNRNFDFVWNTAGTSDDPCSNSFAGPSPASEPETQAISSYVMNLSNQGKIIYYIAFHSYSQLMIVPHSHLTSSQVLQVDNYADMFEIAVRGAEVLKKRHGTTYRVGISADVLYPMSGTSFDWAKNAANIPVAYLIELRDLGDYGFLLPADQIVSNNLEIMDALLEMDRATRDLGYYERVSGAESVVTSTVLLALGAMLAILN